jgi:hypothetical protein
LGCTAEFPDENIKKYFDILSIKDLVKSVLAAEVVIQSFRENLMGQKVIHHSYDRGTLVIRNSVKDFIDLIWMSNFNGNWVRGF